MAMTSDRAVTTATGDPGWKGGKRRANVGAAKVERGKVPRGWRAVEAAQLGLLRRPRFC